MCNSSEQALQATAAALHFLLSSLCGGVQTACTHRAVYVVVVVSVRHSIHLSSCGSSYSLTRMSLPPWEPVCVRKREQVLSVLKLQPSVGSRK